MNCPLCKQIRLETLELEPGLTASQCSSCSGLWIANARYLTWQKNLTGTGPEQTPAGQLQIEDIPKAKICPGCGHFMLKYRIGHGLGFFIDHCRACGGFWLDRNEWQELKAHGLHALLNRIVSEAWQKDIRAEETQRNMREMYIAQLGEKTYERMVEIRKWLDEQPKKNMIIGYLTTPDGNNAAE